MTGSREGNVQEMGSASADGFESSSAPGPAPCLLLVAADPGLGSVLGSALASLGVLRIVGHDGALEAARTHSPDLVLVEAGPQAVEVLRSLRGRAETRLVPILVVGASPTAAEAADVFAAGADDCLPADTVPAAIGLLAEARLGRARAWQDALARAEGARDEAEAAGQARDEFLAVMSHELRTPLGALLIWTQILRSERLVEDALRRPLGMIERSARSLAQLIDDLLDVSRIVSGRLRLELRPLEVGPVLDAALRALEAADEGRGVRFEKAADVGLCAVSGDPDRLQQVVGQLLSAAAKAAAPGAVLAVRLQDAGGGVRIAVTGAERRPERGAGEDRREGIRLTLARRLAEMHGGSLEVGAVDGALEVFRLTLPAISAVSLGGVREPGAGTGAGAALPDALGGLRILLVDDEPDAREALALVLERAGATVRAVASAEAALEALRSEPPHVLLSDISMPHEDGYSLIRRVRALAPRAGREIPAAAVTAYATDRERERALLAGYTEHLAKPVDPCTLVDLAMRLGRAGGWRPAAPLASGAPLGVGAG